MELVARVLVKLPDDDLALMRSDGLTQQEIDQEITEAVKDLLVSFPVPSWLKAEFIEFEVEE